MVCGGNGIEQKSSRGFYRCDAGNIDDVNVFSFCDNYCAFPFREHKEVRVFDWNFCSVIKVKDDGFEFRSADHVYDCGCIHIFSLSSFVCFRLSRLYSIRLFVARNSGASFSIPRLSDPDDEPLLQMAVEAQVPIIVTRNTRHLKPAEKFGVKVLTPAGFLAKLKETA